MEQLIAKVRTQPTEMILDCLLIIGGGHVSVDERMARAALIQVYIERTSDEDGDALMDALGL